MDSNRFGHFIRSLSVDASRRRLLAGVLAIVPAGFGVAESAAKKRKKKRKKKNQDNLGSPPHLASRPVSTPTARGASAALRDQLRGQELR